MGIKAWITVNGQHIPIMDGESKIQAVGRFIKSKRDNDKKAITKQLLKTRKDLKVNRRSKDLDKFSAELTAKQLLKNTRPTIKGRKKSNTEIGNELAKNREIAKAFGNNEAVDKYNEALMNLSPDKNKRYKLKEDKPRRAARGELTEKKLYLDYKNNYTTDELKAYKRQLDNHYRQFKNSNKYGDDITARNYRAITTVLAERRKRK